MGYRDVVVRAQTTVRNTACAFYYPQMLSQGSARRIDAKLLRPEIEESLQAVDTLVGEAVVPAIDESEFLRTPAPVASWVHRRVHGILHFVEISYLFGQRFKVYTTHMGVQRAEQHRDTWMRRMDRAFAEIKVLCKALW